MVNKILGKRSEKIFQQECTQEYIFYDTLQSNPGGWNMSENISDDDENENIEMQKFNNYNYCFSSRSTTIDLFN